MGFNNGYDSGWEDAKAELEPKMKALEDRVAELETGSGGAPAAMPQIRSFEFTAVKDTTEFDPTTDHAFFTGQIDIGDVMCTYNAGHAIVTLPDTAFDNEPVGACFVSYGLGYRSSTGNTLDGIELWHRGKCLATSSDAMDLSGKFVMAVQKTSSGLQGGIWVVAIG